MEEDIKAEKFRGRVKSSVTAFLAISVACVSQMLSAERLDSYLQTAAISFAVAIPILSYAYLFFTAAPDDLENPLATFANTGMSAALVGLGAVFLHFGKLPLIAFIAATAGSMWFLYKAQTPGPVNPPRASHGAAKISSVLGVGGKTHSSS